MGPDWSFAVFSYLDPLVQDPLLAARCRAALERAVEAPIAALPSDLDDPELLRLPRLRLIVAELRRRKWAGEPYEEAAAQLGALLDRHAAGFWAAAPLLQQLTFLDSFAKLGIATDHTLDDVLREIRGRWQQGAPEVLLEDAGFVLALTHVFYTASGYFSRYPDPASFGPEIAMLRRALRHYLTVPAPRARHFLDIEAEVLVALRLLRMPEDDEMRAMADRLIGLQNPDGSWGEASGNHAIHATVVAVQALSDWPAAFGSP